MNVANESVMSPYLGEIVWEAGTEIHLPGGLPGFDRQRSILAVEIPSQRPLIYLQSTQQAEICFLALPVLTVDAGFQLLLSEDDRAVLELDKCGPPNQEPPVIGTDVLCLAVLFPTGNTVQTNLDAPIVVNLHNRRAVQAVAGVPVAGSYRLTNRGTWEATCS